MRKPRVMYRYEDAWTTLGPDIRLRKFKVVKLTPHGAWIKPDGYFPLMEQTRFVLMTARKRYACPTKKEAKESFIARKRRQASILSAQLNRVQRVLELTQIRGSLRW